MYGVNTLSRAPRASRLAVAVLALATFSMAADPAEARSRHKGHGRAKAEKAQQEAPAQANIFSALFSGGSDKTETGSLGPSASADAGVSDSRSANRRGRSSAASATVATRGNVPSGTGIASFYGGRHHGGPTASGERFNQNAMTAAHRSAPLGSQMRVTNLNNGKSIVVRINDRGPFVRGRIIDVSKGAAQALGFVSAGLTRVKVEPAT